MKTSKDKIKEGAMRSGELSAERKRQRIIKYQENPTKCSCCQSELPYEKRNNKFCSRSCSVTQANQGKPRHGKKRMLKPCACCGKPTKNKTYCSQQCGGKHSQVKTWKAIEKGTWINKEGRNNKPIRDYLIFHRGHKCECCQQSEWLGQQIPLSVHHINGNATDNILENVVLYCWNCHALTDNFGSKNTESTRSYRYAK